MDGINTNSTFWELRLRKEEKHSCLGELQFQWKACRVTGHVQVKRDPVEIEATLTGCPFISVFSSCKRSLGSNVDGNS